MRFYDVNSGSIKLDGKDIREYKRKEYRENYAMVLQDTWLFQGTINSNLRFGSKGRFMSLEEAIPFAKLFRETEFKEKNMTLFSYGASAETLYERNYIDAAIGEM